MTRSCVFVLSTILLACSDFGTPSEQAMPGSTGEVVLQLSKSALPSDVRTVRYTLQREGFEPIVHLVTVDQQGDTLTTVIEGIPEGFWHLIVTAEDESGAVRYSGASDVYVAPRERTTAVVYMNPVDGSGSIEVHVLWPGTPSLNKEFDIRFGEEVAVDSSELVLKFDDVTEDSRCPYPLMCFWAGNARVLFRVNGQEIALNTSLPSRDTTVIGFTLALRLLRPYPHVDHPIRKDDYIARVRIRRVDERPSTSNE